MSRAIGFGAALSLAAALVVSGCGGDDGPSGDEDAGPGDGGASMDSGGGETDAGGGGDTGVGEDCGDGIVDDGEECDDGNTEPDDGCSASCQRECGDGEVTGDEACDTAIAAGEPGACPTECDDSDSCTTDTLTGSACETECVYGDITAFIDDDSCCPDGATSADDNDCAVECGNGIVESGETCDTAISSGDTGACPVDADCDDAEACTTDTLVDGGTCTAECTNEDITAFIDDDACCPAGATAADDNDCSTTCGDGAVTGAELCDTAISSGAGSCPEMSDCVDGDPCTRDVLQSAGTCSARCRNPAITAPMDGDSCCPAGANETTDDDCSPVCGNGVVETGEECDDGGTAPGDGCDASCMNEIVPTAFRLTSLQLVSPRITVDFLGCNDVTQDAFFGFSVNGELRTAIEPMSAGGDYSLHIVNLFRPLDPSASSTPVELHFNPICDEAPSPDSCGPDPTPDFIMSNANNQSSGTCYMADATEVNSRAGTMTAYTPSLNEADAPCFISDEETLTVTVAGIAITLQQARVAAQYSGSPPTQLVNGVVTGFITEQEAADIILPDSLPLVGGDPLYAHLQAGNRSVTDSSGTSVADGCNVGGGGHEDDADTVSGLGRGFWFFLNFQAEVITWTGS